MPLAEGVQDDFPSDLFTFNLAAFYQKATTNQFLLVGGKKVIAFRIWQIHNDEAECNGDGDGDGSFYDEDVLPAIDLWFVRNLGESVSERIGK